MFLEMLDVLLESLLDTLKIFPFLLAAFMLIALLERQVNARKFTHILKGNAAPVIGSFAGMIPQCGFSVMGAQLFREGCITIGTLVAIFISTSDEGVIVLLSGGRWLAAVMVIAVKVTAGIIVGYAVNALFPNRNHPEEDVEEFGKCHHGGEGETRLHAYFLHPLLHCLKTAGFLLAVNAVLGLVIFAIGEENFISFMNGTEFYQPFVTSLVGLIPNCAPSVVIAQTFVEGNLSFGGLVAGLATNAGVGLAVFLRSRMKLTGKIAVVSLLYVSGVLLGELSVLVAAI